MKYPSNRAYERKEERGRTATNNNNGKVNVPMEALVRMASLGKEVDFRSLLYCFRLYCCHLPL